MGVVWTLALGAYAIGYLASVVIMFRMITADSLIGVHTAENDSERVGLIVLSGLTAFVFSLLWPLMAAALLVYRFAVAPRRNDQRKAGRP